MDNVPNPRIVAREMNAKGPPRRLLVLFLFPPDIRICRCLDPPTRGHLASSLLSFRLLAGRSDDDLRRRRSRPNVEILTPAGKNRTSALSDYRTTQTTFAQETSRSRAEDSIAPSFRLGRDFGAVGRLFAMNSIWIEMAENSLASVGPRSVIARAIAPAENTAR